MTRAPPAARKFCARGRARPHISNKQRTSPAINRPRARDSRRYVAVLWRNGGVGIPCAQARIGRWPRTGGRARGGVARLADHGRFHLGLRLRVRCRRRRGPSVVVVGDGFVATAGSTVVDGRVFSAVGTVAGFLSAPGAADRGSFSTRAAPAFGAAPSLPVLRRQRARDRAQREEAGEGRRCASRVTDLRARAAVLPNASVAVRSAGSADATTTGFAARWSASDLPSLLRRPPRRQLVGEQLLHDTTPAPPSTARRPTTRANDSSAICSACIVGKRSSGSGASARSTISDSAGGYAPIASGQRGRRGATGRDLVQDLAARSRPRRARAPVVSS